MDNLQSNVGSGNANSPDLHAKEHQNKLQIRSSGFRYLLKSHKYSTIAFFGLIILHGFPQLGFQISDTLLYSIGGWTLSQSAALLVFVVKASWDKTGKDP